MPSYLPEATRNRRKNGINVPCASCGSPVYRRPSEMKSNTRGNAFCGQDCYHDFNRGRSRIRSKNEMTCCTCGISFFRSPYAAKEKNYCSKKCSGKGRESLPIGTLRQREEGGYVYIRTERGWESHHRVVMREHVGRDLHDEETVHHRNGVKADNRLENLELWSSKHPKGQRVTDLVEWAKEILATYVDEA